MLVSTYDNFKPQSPGWGLRCPHWTGHMTTNYGTIIPIRWENFTIVAGAVINWHAKDLNGKHHCIFGTIDNSGGVEFKLKNLDGEFKYSGHIRGHNRISGNWQLFGGKQVTYGQFDIQMECQKNFLMHRTVGGQPTSDRYYFGIETYTNKYLTGLGVDNVGYYTLSGKIKGNDKVKMTIEYKRKFTMSCKGNKKQNPNLIEGSWSIGGGGSGDFSLIIQDGGAQNMPQLIDTPFGPTQVPTHQLGNGFHPSNPNFSSGNDIYRPLMSQPPSFTNIDLSKDTDAMEYAKSANQVDYPTQNSFNSQPGYHPFS